MRRATFLRLTAARRISPLFALVVATLFVFSPPSKLHAGTSALAGLREGFANPARQFGVRCWWWWLNSNVTQDAITRDLEEMKAKGFSGAMIFDAGGAEQRGNAPVPAGPLYGSAEWRELFKHALREAQRLGLELGLSIQSGWNLGGPNVTPDFAAKQVTFSEIQLEGPLEFNAKLPEPKSREGYCRDIAVLAHQTKQSPEPERAPIENLLLKAGARELGSSAPDCRFLLNDHPSVPGEEDVLVQDVLDISRFMAGDGTLTWKVPEGQWTILRFGYTLTGARVSTSSGDWQGRVIDYLSRDAFERYWNEVVAPLLQDAGPLAGTVLKELETDSWECGGMNWSPNFAEDFKKYRGYDLTPYLPVLAGKIVESREASNAFLADFRKTLGDCVADNHYQAFAEHAHRHGLEIQPESGGPHAGPLDAIKNLGRSDIVMGEFWAPSPHRPQPVNRFFVKQAAAAAHIYGKRLVAAEAFTTIGPHWDDVLWKSQKPSMDHELCSGLNLIFFHTFTCSPKEMGIPGQEYFAGTHVNPQVTWWEYAGTFVDYINRCQYLVQQGRFVADALYYCGDHVPNLARLKESDPAQVLPGYDYDVTSEEILLRLRVVEGWIVAPGGVRYRLLVLPDHQVLSLAALEKVDELLQQGATVLGPKPTRLVSLVGGAGSQERFQELADRLWGKADTGAGERQIGKGRLIWGKTSRNVLGAYGIVPDFQAEAPEGSVMDYIHYKVRCATEDLDVYFVCNQTGEPVDVLARYRVENKAPELWDPLTGAIRKEVAFTPIGGRTEIPLRFGPYGSLFVVFRSQVPSLPPLAGHVNYRHYTTVQEIAGPWQVEFDPEWGGPKEVTFDTPVSWTERPEPGIRFYSGKATYRKTFAFDEKLEEEGEYVLDIGDVGDIGIARVKLNGKDLGVLWTPPFRVDVSETLKPGQNTLEASVVNSWRNRLVGDRDLPPHERYTRTNITLRPEWQLLPSGLLGPVTIQGSVH